MRSEAQQICPSKIMFPISGKSGLLVQLNARSTDEHSACRLKMSVAKATKMETLAKRRAIAPVIVSWQ